MQEEIDISLGFVDGVQPCKAKDVYENNCTSDGTASVLAS